MFGFLVPCKMISVHDVVVMFVSEGMNGGIREMDLQVVLEQKLTNGCNPCRSEIRNRDGRSFEEKCAQARLHLAIMEIDEDHLSSFRHRKNRIAKHLQRSNAHFRAEIE